MSAEANVELVGPEGTRLVLPLASAAERIGAFLLDLAVLVVLWILGIFGMVGLGLTVGSIGVALGLVLLFFIRHGYFLFFESWLSGATPGKRVVGLRVVSRDGGRLQVESLVARNLMRDLETFVPLVVLLAPEAAIGEAPGWLRFVAGAWALVISAMPLYTKERLRSGDLLGGTVVVRIPAAPLLGDAGRHATRDVGFERDQLAIYGEHELETLATMLRSYDDGATTLDDLRTVALVIQRKVGFQGDEPRTHPREFLRTFYSAQRAALEQRLVLGHRKRDKFDGKTSR